MSTFKRSAPPELASATIQQTIAFLPSLWDATSLDAGVVPIPESPARRFEPRLAAKHATPSASLPWLEVGQSTLKWAPRERGQREDSEPSRQRISRLCEPDNT